MTALSLALATVSSRRNTFQNRKCDFAVDQNIELLRASEANRFVMIEMGSRA